MLLHAMIDSAWIMSLLYTVDNYTVAAHNLSISESDHRSTNIVTMYSVQGCYG